MGIIPIEISGIIVSFLPQDDVKKWIILAILSNNKDLSKELKRTYFNIVSLVSPQQHILYKIYFDIESIVNWKTYLKNITLFNDMFQKRTQNFQKCLDLRLHLADKLNSKEKTKFLNITKYIERYPQN